MTINIVIPMAGQGVRFAKEGYRCPKAFILIGGKMMIEHVLDNLPLTNAELTIIVQKCIENTHGDKLAKLRNRYKAKISFVDRLTAGAACTAMSAHESIDSNAPVMFVDSDNIFTAIDVQKFIEDAHNRSLDGSLLTFPSTESCFSYIEADEKGNVIQTKEKDVISNHAIAGAYFFAKGRDFVRCAIKMIIYADKTKGEFYISNVYNYMIKEKKKIGYYVIMKSRFDCVGTPQLLSQFIQNKNI